MDMDHSSLVAGTAVLDWAVLPLPSLVEAAVARMAGNNTGSSTAVEVTETAGTVAVDWAS